MEDKSIQKDKPVIRTPDYRLRVLISSTLKELAEEREAARQLDHLEVARASFEECIRVARNIGNPGALIASLVGAAIIGTRLFQKQPDQNGKEQTPSLMNTVRLLGAVPSLNQNIHMFFWVGWGSDVYEQAVARARRLTTDETWERAFAEGGTLSMQQALAIALPELQRQ